MSWRELEWAAAGKVRSDWDAWGAWFWLFQNRHRKRPKGSPTNPYRPKEEQKRKGSFAEASEFFKAFGAVRCTNGDARSN